MYYQAKQVKILRKRGHTIMLIFYSFGPWLLYYYELPVNSIQCCLLVQFCIMSVSSKSKSSKHHVCSYELPVNSIHCCLLVQFCIMSVLRLRTYPGRVFNICLFRNQLLQKALRTIIYIVVKAHFKDIRVTLYRLNILV